MELLSLLYIFIDVVLALAFVVLCFRRSWWTLAVIVAYFGHPLVTEPVLKATFSTIYARRARRQPPPFFDGAAPAAVPIVYDARYNIEFFGLEKRHSFDARKYARAMELLEAEGPYPARLAPGDPDYAFIYAHVGLRHLTLLNYSLYFSKIAELKLAFVPGSLLRWFALRPFLYATQGTVAATEAALQTGLAINLGGGFHHAHAEGGSGFCFYNDIGLAVEHLRRHHATTVERIMIVDLDAHQGNGHARDKQRRADGNVFIFDAYNPDIFPHDDVARQAIDRSVHLTREMDDAEYLLAVSTALEESLALFRPNFVIYNAGTDILAGDRLGQLDISPAGVVERDAMVVQKLRDRSIPGVMLLSGGYQRTNAAVIAESIVNLNRRFYGQKTASPSVELLAVHDERASPRTPLLAQQR